MAYGDYIHCATCDCKLIYDGNDNARESLEAQWGDPGCHEWTVEILCPDCQKEKDARIAALEAENAQMAALAKFGLACLIESRDSLGDLDGGWIQDEAVRCGLLIETTVHAPCGDECLCAESGDFPMRCYKYSDEIRAALAEPPKHALLPRAGG